MSQEAASGTSSLPGPGTTGFLPRGRMFIHPAVDYLLIGGGLSLIIIPFLPHFADSSLTDAGAMVIPAAILFSNSAHFAGSTVRLYSKDGMFRDRPFFTMGFPLVMLALLTFSIAFADLLGEAVYRFYLIWSPYHYAAQAYGLASMYAYRSGCRLQKGDSDLLWWTAMMPFFHAFMYADTGGIGWFISTETAARWPDLILARQAATDTLRILTFAMPVLLVWRLHTGNRSGLPMISLLIIVSNGVWWVMFEYMNAFAWATIAHGLQYLVILTVFHVRDHVPADATRRDRMLSAAKFYGSCLVLGYFLFQVLPYAYVVAGFPLSTSMLLVAAVVSMHHFAIDRVIWRLRKDTNLKVVVR